MMYFREALLRAQEQAILKLGKCNKRPVWLRRDLLTELKLKKKAYKNWKLGHSTWGEYKNII